MGRKEERASAGISGEADEVWSMKVNVGGRKCMKGSPEGTLCFSQTQEPSKEQFWLRDFPMT